MRHSLLASLSAARLPALPSGAGRSRQAGASNCLRARSLSVALLGDSNRAYGFRFLQLA